MKSAPAIAFEYRTSRWLVAALVGTAVLALIALAVAGLAAWLKFVGASAVCLQAGYSLRGLLRHPVRRCAWHDSGHWRVRDRDGVEHVAALVRATVRGPLIALVLSAGPLRRVALVLLPDNCDVDTGRRLRIRLSHLGAGAETTV